MKSSIAVVIVLASGSTALRSFGFPSDSGTGSGTGSSFFSSLPSFASLPSAGGGTAGGGTGSSWLSWLSGERGGGDSTSTTPSTPDPSTTPEESTGGDTGGSSTSPIGSDCSSQSSGGLGGSTENGIISSKCCAAMTIIFARGTGELGNVGTVSGPPMFRAIRQKLGAGSLTVQGVDYPASAGGIASQGGTAGATMSKHIDQALSQCPDSKVIVSGYSQGAMVVHNAKPAASKVAGAVLFGDPLKRMAVGDLSADNVKQFCGTSDMVCGGGGDGGATGGHLSYGSSAAAAAEFAIKVAGLA